MKDLSFNTQQLIPELLERIPGLNESYDEYVRLNVSGALTKEDKDELEEIARLRNLPQLDYDLPGMTIVFENLLVPYLVDLSGKKEAAKELEDAMDWMEELAVNEHFAVRNLVAGSLCVPLVTNHSNHLGDILPFMGKETIALCKMVSTGYRVDKQVKRLLDL